MTVDVTAKYKQITLIRLMNQPRLNNQARL